MGETYPELDYRRYLLRAIYERLEQAYENGQSALTFTVDDVSKLGEEIQLNEAKTNAKVKELADEGYLRTHVVAMAGMWGVTQAAITILALTDKGKLEIGAIPDPRQRLILGFEGTIRELEADRTLDEEEKSKRINWAQEAIALVRGLSVELAARIITGELPPR
jgi:hypothetical protein